jgi:hypothetical protein
MAQVTIYLADEVAAEVRKQARRADKPLSTFLAEIIEAHTKPPTWPQAFVTLLTTGGADLVEPDDPAPEEREPMR